MAGWAPSHGASHSVGVLCERIVVAQTDEIAMSQRWLREHGEYVPPPIPATHHAGHGSTDAHAGMLTPEQMHNWMPRAVPSSIGCSSRS